MSRNYRATFTQKVNEPFILSRYLSHSGKTHRIKSQLLKGIYKGPHKLISAISDAYYLFFLLHMLYFLFIMVSQSSQLHHSFFFFFNWLAHHLHLYVWCCNWILDWLWRSHLINHKVNLDYREKMRGNIFPFYHLQTVPRCGSSGEK